MNRFFPALSKYRVVVGLAVVFSTWFIGPRSREATRALFDQHHVRFHEADPYLRIQKAMRQVSVGKHFFNNRVPFEHLNRRSKIINYSMDTTHPYPRDHTSNRKFLLIEVLRSLDSSLEKAPYHPYIARVHRNQAVAWIFHGINTTHENYDPNQSHTPGKQGKDETLRGIYKQLYKHSLSSNH